MNEDLRQKLIHGGGWVIAGRFLGLAAALGVNALLARLLPPSDLGAWFLTMTVATTASTICGLGLPAAVVRFAAEAHGIGDSGRARRSVLLAFAWGAGGAAVAALLVAAGPGKLLSRAVFGSEAMAAVMPLAGIWTFVMAMQQLQAEAFRGVHDIRDATIFGGLAVSIVTAIVLFAMRMSLTRASLAAIVTVAAAVALAVIIAGAFVLRRRLTHDPARNDLSSAELLRVSMPLWMSAVTMSIVSQADLWIAGAFLPESSVAVYGAASRLAIYLAVPLTLVNAVVPPFVGEMYARGQRIELQRMLQGTAAAAAIPALALALPLWIFAAPVLRTIFGPPYAAGATILILLTIGQMANVFTGSCGMTLAMTGHQRVVMIASLVSAVLTVSLALLLVRRYGTTGVAVAAASGVVVQNVWMWLYARRAGIRTHASFGELARLLRGSGAAASDRPSDR